MFYAIVSAFWEEIEDSPRLPVMDGLVFSSAAGSSASGGSSCRTTQQDQSPEPWKQGGCARDIVEGQRKRDKRERKGERERETERASKREMEVTEREREREKDKEREKGRRETKGGKLILQPQTLKIILTRDAFRSDTAMNQNFLDHFRLSNIKE